MFINSNYTRNLTLYFIRRYYNIYGRMEITFLMGVS